ncbi:MAG: apolipoprotein N-acyltransferase, partial [Mycobacterium sp.]|nr:apolipoprotein N-acyltransferase [Mycobacterium sp.]
MVRGIGRFDRRVRPAEDTDVFPAVKDYDNIGQIPLPPAAAADAEVTGVIPAVRDVEAAEEDADVADESQDADAPVVGNDRLAELRDQAIRVGKYLWQRLVYLSAVLLAWLVRETRIRVPQAGRWLRPRWTRLTAAILAGLLLCASYPPFNWWWAAVIAFGVLAWVLTRQATTPVGGFGYGFLFGLAFYLPLIRWISILVGAMPLLALVLMCAVFPGIFGLGAVVVRRLPGWAIWFAVLWAAQEWLKSTIPFGGFPWGVVAAGQTSGPFLPLVRLGGVPLLSLAIVLTGCSAAAFAMETVSWWLASRRRHAGADEESADAPPAVVLPAFCICLVFFVAAAVWPQVRHSGT